MKRTHLVCWLLAIMLLLCTCGNAESTSESTQPTRLSFEESAVLFNQEHSKFMGLIDDLNYAFTYYIDTEITTLDEIHAYEARWQAMADKAKAIQECMMVNRPPVAYEEAWDGFAASMGKLSEVCLKGTDLNHNHDDEYTGEEMTALLQEIGDEFINTANEAQDYAIQLEETAAQNTTTNNAENNDNANGNGNGSKRVCVECGEDAYNSYTNPFSGKQEYYCKSHYEEIIDMLGEMESDVGSSSQSKHTCEMCSKEGTHVYDSFTGQTEYYCTEHYEELMDMLEALGVG